MRFPTHRFQSPSPPVLPHHAPHDNGSPNSVNNNVGHTAPKAVFVDPFLPSPSTIGHKLHKSHSFLHLRRRRFSHVVACIYSHIADVLVQSVLLSTLFGAAFVLIPILLAYLYFSYLVATPAYDPHHVVYDRIFGAAHPVLSSLNLSIHNTLETPLSHRNICRQLEHTFSLPTTLSERIPTPQRYALLSKLQYLSTNDSSPRVFILHVVGPSADRRLRAIASAITYARNTDRILVVLWDTAHAPGGDAHDGKQPLTDIQTSSLPDMIFGYVHSLHLAPDITHWTDYSITYFTAPPTETFPLDNIAKLATRHIFYRSDNQVNGKYAALLPGVFILPTYLNLASTTTGETIRGEWDSIVNRWTFPQLDDTQVPDILHRVYSIPRIFLAHMMSARHRMLLHLLDRSKSKRAFFVHVQYGMGNRLRALGSALAISRVTGRVPVLIWEPDIHLDCRFRDLFVNELVIIEKLEIDWPPRKRDDNTMESVDFFNFMRNEGKGRHDPTRNLVNPRQGRHVYAKSAYVIRSSFTPRILSTRSKYWKIMREELVPRVDIMMIVLDPMFANIDEMVGVHIRARTIENDIKGVGHEVYGAASKTTDQWRKRTGLKTFEEKIRRLSLKYNYFVAADMKETIEELERKFGEHRIYSVPRENDCVSRGVECAKLALADILLLSRVSTLLGSHWSSFSESAVRFSGTVKLLLAGVHFG